LFLLLIQSDIGRVFWCRPWSTVWSVVWEAKQSVEKGNTFIYSLKLIVLYIGYRETIYCPIELDIYLY